jgi:3-hydroxy-9,10-secoandrosta-1,3,5(10)-triene-9,17-dione monooxygenase reductase component
MLTAPVNTTVNSVEPALFQQALSRLAAGTSVVTVMDENGIKMGLTATAVTSVSLEPPMILVCINANSRTIEPLKAGRTFVVNFLSQSQQKIATQFASKTGDKFAGVLYYISENDGIHLANVLSSVECTPEHIYPGGDHWIIVGRVQDIQLGADPNPLVYFRGQFL